MAFWSDRLPSGSRYGYLRRKGRRSPTMRIANILRTLTLLGMAAGVWTAPAAAQTLDKVSFGTNWVAQAEHGGFFQAVADGTYAKHNLDVTIVPGGPQANNRMLLPVGRIDFYMGGNMLQSFSAVEEHIPTLVVAAIFQQE